jgi:hypothetical protein
MARMIKVECHTCHHVWHEDLDKHQNSRVIYRDEAEQTKVEEYTFRCPRDGTYVVVKVTLKE